MVMFTASLRACSSYWQSARTCSQGLKSVKLAEGAHSGRVARISSLASMWGAARTRLVKGSSRRAATSSRESRPRCFGPAPPPGFLRCFLKFLPVLLILVFDLSLGKGFVIFLRIESPMSQMVMAS